MNCGGKIDFFSLVSRENTHIKQTSTKFLDHQTNLSPQRRESYAMVKPSAIDSSVLGGQLISNKQPRFLPAEAGCVTLENAFKLGGGCGLLGFAAGVYYGLEAV